LFAVLPVNMLASMKADEAACVEHPEDVQTAFWP